MRDARHELPPNLQQARDGADAIVATDATDAIAATNATPVTAAPNALHAPAPEERSAAPIDTIQQRTRERLQTRMLQAQGPLRQALAQRLEAAQARNGAPIGPAVSGPAPASTGHQDRRPAQRLAELNRLLAGRAQADTPGLRSLPAFRQTWTRLSADERARRATAQGPDKPGPLNSHMLVLRSLELMRRLSPDYLRSFLDQLDTLLWIEDAQRRLTPAPEAKPARRKRARR